MLCASAASAQWSIVATVIDGGGESIVRDMQEFNGDLFVAGDFTHIDSNNAHCQLSFRFDGTNIIRQLVPFTGTGIEKMAVYNDQLLAVGTIRNSADSTHGVATWQDTTWANTPSPIPEGTVPDLYSLASFGGDLFVAGRFYEAPFRHIARSEGSGYVDVNGGFDNAVFDLEVYNGELYAGGEFHFPWEDGNAQWVARWDGSQWQELGPGLGYYVTDMEVFDGALYIAGKFGPDHLLKWDGDTLTPVGGGITVSSMASYIDRLILKATSEGLYIAGNVTSADGIPVEGLAVWDGSNWHDPGALPDPDLRITAIEEYQGHVYAAAFHEGYPVYERSSTLYRKEVVLPVVETLAEEFRAFPNPVSDVLHTTGTMPGILPFVICDVVGRTIKAGAFTGSVAVGDLPAGRYLLTLTSKDRTQRTAFIKR